MKKITNLIFYATTSLLLATYSTFLPARETKIDCKNITCLHKKFDSCSDDPSTCFKILNTQLKNAKKCKKKQHSRDFLLTVKFLGNNVEASEYMSEEIENFFIEKPKCFLEAALLLDKDTQREVMERVQNPQMVEDGKTKIEKNISKFKQEKSFSRLFTSPKKSK